MCRKLITTLALGPILALYGMTASADSLAAASKVIDLKVDATGSARRVLKAHMTMPVEAGPLTLYYPKWIPGEHAPRGEVENLFELSFSAAGQRLAWRRDLVDGHAFHLLIPPGVRTLDAISAFCTARGEHHENTADASANLLMLRWNRIVLYPSGPSIEDINVQATLSLPPRWDYATALTTQSRTMSTVTFAPTSVAELVDAPVLAGKFVSKTALSSPGTPPVELDIAGDTPSSVVPPAALIEGYRRNVDEARRLFGAEHYRHYNFLVSSSNFVHGGGIEHHESSDDRVARDFFSDPNRQDALFFFFSHEYVHSWIGKYRSPVDLFAGDLPGS